MLSLFLTLKKGEKEMKRSISTILIGIISIGVVFSAYKKVPKNEKMQYRQCTN